MCTPLLLPRQQEGQGEEGRTARAGKLRWRGVAQSALLQRSSEHRHGGYQV